MFRGIAPLILAIAVSSSNHGSAATNKAVPPNPLIEPSNGLENSYKPAFGTEESPLIVHEDESPRTKEEGIIQQRKDAADLEQRNLANILSIALAGVGFLQLVILWIQILILRRQINHSETSERAWFWCRASIEWQSLPSEEVKSSVAFTFVNSGKTPGFITEIGFKVEVLPKGASLPSDIPNYDNADHVVWEGRGLMTVPNNTISRLGGFTATKDILPEIRKKNIVVWVHGFVRYRDIFVSGTHITRYCFEWNPDLEKEDSSFVISGPSCYNSAT